MTKQTEKLIAVYGAMRSGTTLLRLMLDQHQDVSCPGETDYVFDHLKQDERGVWHCEVHALNQDRIFQIHRSKFPDPLPTPMSPEFIVGCLFEKEQHGILMLHRHLDRILDIYPDMKIIHLLRDPRDVARSSIAMNWASNVYHGASHWIDTELLWAQYGTKLPAHQVLTLHYEKMIKEPESQLQRLCEFIGFDFDYDMLNYDQRSTYSKPDVSLTYQWKRKQTPYEIGLVEARIGPLLESCGYQPSGHPPKPLAGPRKLLLNVRNRASIYHGRIKRYGLKNWLTAGLAQRLRMRRLSEAVRLRQHQIENKNIK